MFYILNNNNVQDFISESWYSDNAKSALDRYYDLLKSGRKLQARIYRYSNGDEQLRIYEYDKANRRYVLIEKIFID